MLNDLLIRDIVKNALIEDIGSGDITTALTVPEDTIAAARVTSKEDGVICGIDVFRLVFDILDPNVKFTPLLSDGDQVKAGTDIATLEGPARSLLTGERVALNFLQRLSGIATRTSKLAKMIEGTKTRVVDTRKTTPGLRIFEKYAVRVGGGRNHRYGLDDGILIKDNHIAAAGGITPAIESAKRQAPHTLKIEIETTTLDQVKEAIEAGADILLLDNMTPEQIREAVEIIAGRALVEVSGNVTESNIRELATAGVDIISSGALTHSVKALDISMNIV